MAMRRRQFRRRAFRRGKKNLLWIRFPPFTLASNVHEDIVTGDDWNTLAAGGGIQKGAVVQHINVQLSCNRLLSTAQLADVSLLVWKTDKDVNRATSTLTNFVNEDVMMFRYFNVPAQGVDPLTPPEFVGSFNEEIIIKSRRRLNTDDQIRIGATYNATDVQVSVAHSALLVLP